MGELLDPPEGVAGLAVAARRYAANLLAAAADFYPGALAAVRTFFGLVGRAETEDDPDDDPPGKAAWAWARFLAGWPEWRPHRLERRLLLPPADVLARLAVRSREAAEPHESGTARRWSLFSRQSQPVSPVEPRELLAKYAEILDAIATPPTLAARAALDRAVDLGRVVDDAFTALPRDWVPLRLARAAGLIAEWPPDPPDDAPPGFLPWLAHLLRVTLERGPCPAAPDVFTTVLREALDDLRAEGHVPAEGETFAALDAFRRIQPPPPEDAWFRVLVALLDLAATADPHTKWPRLLARLACEAVEQVVPNVEPPVDAESLAVAPDWFRPGRAAARYVVHPTDPRAVVRIDRFAVVPAKPALTISLGPRPPGTTIWLSAVDSDRLTGLPEGEWKKLAARCRRRAEAEFWNRTPEENDTRTLREAWAAWLLSEPGREWFHALVAKAAADGEESAETRVWLAAVGETARVRCFPLLDLQSGRVSWPADLPFTQAAVSFTPDDSPPGTILSVERFAPQPAAARFRVSLGPMGATGMAIATVWEAITEAGLELDDFRTLLAPALDAAARTGEPVPIELLARMLDELGPGVAEPSAFTAQEALLARLRAWAAAEGLTLLPTDWTFAAGGPAPAAETDGLAVKAVFRRDVPAGRVAKVKAFGLVGPEAVIRGGEVVVSAGPPPHELAKLETAAESIPGPAGEELREGFRGLRSAGAGGYLELAAVDLFTRFWDHVHPAWSPTDPAAADNFAERLRVMLRETFGLEAFTPLNYRDHQAGWVTVPPGTRMTTGRVSRVLRPGLAAGEVLRVPARVEAE